MANVSRASAERVPGDRRLIKRLGDGVLRNVISVSRIKRLWFPAWRIKADNWTARLVTRTEAVTMTVID